MYTFTMGRCIVITSGKGGVGKTTVTAGLGLALAKNKSRVIVVDADITLNNLDLVLGLEGNVVYDLNDVILGKCRLSQALVQHSNASLRLLPSIRGEDIPLRDFRKVMLELKEDSDFLLIDCPAGLDEGFTRAVDAASEAIVVTTPTPSAIRDADKVISVLNKMKIKRASLVVNRVRGDLIVEGSMLSPEEIANLLKIRLIGCIPEDDHALDYTGLGHEEHSLAIKMLARYISVGSGEIFDATDNFRGLLGGLRRILKKV